MKKLITYSTLLCATMLVACSSDEDFAGLEKDSAALADYNTVQMPELQTAGSQGMASKSSLSYNYITGGTTFKWEIDDEMGIYPLIDPEEDPSEIPAASSSINSWVIKQLQDDATLGIFDADDEHIEAHLGHSYIAVYPYIADDVDYRDIPINYDGQKQTASSKLGCYEKGIGGDETELAKYVTSEETACSHLSVYDYMVDTERQATEVGGKMHFQMQRLSAIVRFFMTVPGMATETSRMVFDSLQLYNASKMFANQTELDASTGEYSETPTRQSHVLSLQLGDYGFDYTACSADDDYYRNGRWVMTGYLMVPPIDLDTKSTLYLIGRQPALYADAGEYNTANGTSLTDEQFAALTTQQRIKVYANVAAFNTAKGTSLTDGQFAALTTAQKMKEWTRKVYKAELVEKNLGKDFLYQWSTTEDEDEPIEFEEIQIQEWEKATGFTNEDGYGTEDW